MYAHRDDLAVSTVLMYDFLNSSLPVLGIFQTISQHMKTKLFRKLFILYIFFFYKPTKIQVVLSNDSMHYILRKWFDYSSPS